MSAVATVRGIELREATPADNRALIELASACSMDGAISLRVDREPDFFALNALEGSAWRVGVARHGDEIIGCVAASRRLVWMNGAPSPMGYASDFKVHPVWRGTGAADMLARWVTDTIAELCRDDTPTLLTILGGNSRMENRVRGPRGAPRLARFASLSVRAIPLLYERRHRVSGIAVRAARPGDVEAMAALWREVAPRRQLADVLDAGSLTEWIRRAPGLSIEDYLLAHDRRGRLLGFMGVWDQSGFKTLRVVGYSPRLAVVRRAINAVAPMAGAPRLPEPGGALPILATVHICAAQPRVLRALILEAYRRHRGGRHALLSVGLDARDPLIKATRGLLAQPTAVHAYVTTPKGKADPSMFDGRPLHYETALV
jgi:hypothetical protein